MEANITHRGARGHYQTRGLLETGPWQGGKVKTTPSWQAKVPEYVCNHYMKDFDLGRNALDDSMVVKLAPGAEELLIPDKESCH